MKPVHSLNNELGAENVAQLGSISVAAASDLLLVVVVIGRCQQMAKDELGHVHFLLGMNGNRNTLAVVLNRNRVRFSKCHV